MLKDFSLKFIDMMVGVVLGLGFQWITSLTETWHYIAFIFVYLDVIDYWIDYSPSLKKFPPKREIDVVLDVLIVFSLFLYIYSTQSSIMVFLWSFFFLRFLDYFWLLSSKHEYHPTGTDRVFVDTWLQLNILEACVAIGLILLAMTTALSPLTILLIYIVLRVLVRVFASLRYKKIHFA